MSATKVPIGMRALAQRINRRLAKQDETLKKARSARGLADLGAYYILNRQTNSLVAWHVDPGALAAELGLLTPWETVDKGAP